MWILNKYGTALNLGNMIVLRCDSERTPFRVNGWANREEGSSQPFYLAEFETRADAKAYIADLVNKLNGELPQQDLRALTTLNDLSHIRDELKIIYDSLYPPEKRDIALRHTKELISYVELLFA